MQMRSVFVVVLVCGALAVPAMAVDIVNDTWIDGERHFPASPVYSEFGVDGDGDGDIESAWFAGGSGVFDPVGAGGPLRIDQTTSSASLTTYFTAEGSELTLSNPGDSIRVTMQFQVSGQVLANTSHGIRFALADSPAASRVDGESTPGSAAYTGYSLFANMNPNTFNRSDPIELYERADPVGGGNFLSSSSAWSAIADAGGRDNPAYQPGVDYTLIMQVTRDGSGDLDILASMSGAGLDGTGSMVINETLFPNGGSYSFDTFAFRPDGYDKAWQIIDTSSFQVEFIPEPGSIMLMLAGLGLLVATRRKR